MTAAHPDCGQPVEFAAGEVFDPDGSVHLCVDYLAWHLPPDSRHPSDLDVPDGWKPAPPAAEVQQPLAA